MKDQATFKNNVRVRSCGLLMEDDKILLLKHQGIGKKGFLWSPPGGGVEFGDSCENTIIREFEEETGLKVGIERFLFLNEYINPELHALEVFYQVKKMGGKLGLGYDPELSKNNQILTEIKFFSFEEINKMDMDEVHNAFNGDENSENIFNIQGMIKFHNI